LNSCRCEPPICTGAGSGTAYQKLRLLVFDSNVCSWNSSKFKLQAGELKPFLGKQQSTPAALASPNPGSSPIPSTRESPPLHLPFLRPDLAVIGRGPPPQKFLLGTSEAFHTFHTSLDTMATNLRAVKRRTRKLGCFARTQSSQCGIPVRIYSQLQFSLFLPFIFQFLNLISGGLGLLASRS
jgi:hypothetical protein